MFSKDDAVLVLEDGQVYVGEPYGARGSTCGEIVFATGMTGYQETLTDPSYDRQIVVQTFPHIGDTGINGEDPESSRIWVAGYVVREPSPNVSNWRATGSLDDDLVANGIVGICRIDTRKLVRHLRSAGVMRAGVFSGEALEDANGRLRAIDDLLDQVKATPQMQGLSLYDEVSTKQTYTIEPCGEYEGKEPLFTVAAVDLGIKAMTPHRMAERRAAAVHVVPSTITFETAAGPEPGRRVLLERPRRPGAGPSLRWSCCARCWTPDTRSSASASAISCWGRALGVRHVQAQVRTPRHQPAGQGHDHRQDRGHRAQPRLRRRRPDRRDGSVPVR